MYELYNRPVIGKSKNSRKKSKLYNKTLIDNHINEVRKSDSKTAFILDVDYSMTPFKDIDTVHVVYVLRHKRSGGYYVGIHSNITDDVLTSYFTSSKLMLKIIDIEGLQSVEYIHAIYTRTRDIAKIIERDLIKLNWSSKNSLNRSYEAINGTIFHVKYCDNYMGIPIHDCCINRSKPNKNKEFNYCKNLSLSWCR